MNHRRALLRLLLIAVFLHTCIGLPLHEAEHLRTAIGTGLETARVAPDDTPAPAKPAHAVEHGPCVSCMAFAQPAALPTSIGWTLPEADAGGSGPQSAAAFAFVPAPGRWPFASRDPPARIA